MTETTTGSAAGQEQHSGQDQPVQWREQARASGLPTFPIVIFADEQGRWRKKPLTPHGHRDASFNPDRFESLWDRANGFGIAMGQVAAGIGYFGLDLDLHKGPEVEAVARAWLAKWGVPFETRRHRTVSGGEHWIYALASKYLTLPSRANIVEGLDARGEGGWLAYGRGYQIIDDRAPVILPGGVCEEIRRGWKGGLATGAGGADGEIELATYTPPNTAQRAAIEARLGRLLDLDGRRQTFTARWERGEKTTGDQSASAMDHSLAKLLALRGFTPDEIIFVLAELYRFGIAARDGLTYRTMRALGRCAVKAVSSTDAERLACLAPAQPTYTAEDVDAVAAELFGKASS